jgi:hypothetical protein
MHLSTSSSEAAAPPRTHGRRAVWLAIALLAILAILLEATGRFAFVHVSSIQRRVDAQYKASVRMTPTLDGKPSLLVLGNSLMLEGLNVREFSDAVQSAYTARAFFVENTRYFDWYYGLRRLFREGARPHAVLLGLSINQVVADEVRGEYFAHFLMDDRDLPAISRQQKLDPTIASTWLFANWSGWLGSKAEIRSYVLGHTLTNLGPFTRSIVPPAATPPDIETLERIAGPRLSALKDLCDEHGARIILVVPPSPDLRDPYLTLEQIGDHAGVPMSIPYPPGSMPAQNYQDGYHLNASGATLFSRRLAEYMLAQR